MDQQLSSDECPFGSLGELRSKHASLLRESRTLSGKEFDAQVMEFIKRAQATGAIVQNPNDRDSVQGVLDYWAAWRFSEDSREALTAASPVLADFVPTTELIQRPTENPYVGLRAYEERDNARFIGREEAARSLLEKVKRHRIVFLSG